MQERKILTAEQKQLVDELVETHGLDASQISFEGDSPIPIFDYEAVCALSLKLTDIQSIECEITDRDLQSQSVSARCIVTLPDGRTRISSDTAWVGENFANGETIDSIRLAENVAQARAVRRGIRSVGVNLFRAHQNFLKSGKPAEAHINNDPRLPIYQEIHVLASKIGYIVGADKTKYQQFIAETYDGRTSAKELNDIELHRLLVTFRAMARLNPSVANAA